MSNRIRDSSTSQALLPGAGNSPDYGLLSSNSVAQPQSTLVSNGTNRVWTVTACSLIVCLASLVNGMMLGFSSPALTQLQVDNSGLFNDTSVEYSLFGAFGPIGATFGGIVAWPLSDMLGRQAALMLSGIPALSGWLLIACAHFTAQKLPLVAVLLTGRLLTGFSAGWSVFCVSVYISEVASAKLKGVFGNCNQLFVTIGIFLSYFFGIDWPTHNSDSNSKSYYVIEYWKLALIAAGMVALFEILMLFTYETPRWLFSKGKEFQAIRVLSALRGPTANFSREIERIKSSLRHRYSMLEQLMEFKQRAIYFPFMLVIMLMFFQQFSGINVAIFYASNVFLEAGLGQKTINLITAVAVGIVQILATLLSVLLVDYLGRRVLLTVSSVGMALSSLVLGVYFFFFNHKCNGCLLDIKKLNCLNDTIHQHFPCNTPNFGYLAIACIIIFIVAFSLGWGPIPWTSMSELMPNRVRTLSGSIATFANWAFATTITLCFKYYSNAVKNYFAWWTFSVIMFVAIIVVYLFLPETKGHSLEEIQEKFEEGKILAVSCERRHKRSYSPVNSNHHSSVNAD